MLFKKMHKIFIIIVLISIISILFNIQYISKNIQYISKNKQYMVKNTNTMDLITKDIYVPPAQYSHSKYCTSHAKLKYPNTWNNLLYDNNIPGLLPGPIIGDQLGLENNPILSLSTPIRAPLVDNIFPKNFYNKYRFQSCNPYNLCYQ